MPVCVYRPWCTLRAVQPPKTRTPSLQRRCLLRYESQVLLVRLCPRQHVQQDGRILVSLDQRSRSNGTALNQLCDYLHCYGLLHPPSGNMGVKVDGYVWWVTGAAATEDSPVAYATY
eukprot:jgi/Chrzof1/14597/Cz09g08250.t1